MSLLKRIFGQRTRQEEQTRADALFAEREFGAAKLAYERALRVANAGPDSDAALRERINACCDAIAEDRLAQAREWLEDGQLDLAVDELRSVIDTAASEMLVREAEAEIERIDRRDAERTSTAFDLDPADRLEVIAASWNDDQLAEYAVHGEPLRDALLLLHDGAIKAAREQLEAIASEAAQTTDSCYLHFELGRARLADGDTGAGVGALETFLSKLPQGQGGEALLVSRMELALCEHASGDFDAAVRHYEAALEALPKDPRPYLALAAFFRKEKLAQEAVEVLQAGLSVQSQARPEWRIWHELGLSHADCGNDDQAMEWLGRAIDYLVSQKHLDLPPEGTVRLAQLFEKQGKPARALDLYSLLAQGSDRANLALYHVEAARLMQDLGLVAEARRMLQRARGFDAASPELNERITRALSVLDTRG